ncbi:Avr9/Cf-9 rapidly elicited protein [Quillaja saponaria]|uniref:Avr9/Cf-9 rapidly elicited protein n=1 Tax=Quillaja saponaria TaxID=32244 RepID=A0AAD7M413_QUISA|nr:Avr9/Cf-9 rapidly elicited protein [Quillaja saponaria]
MDMEPSPPVVAKKLWNMVRIVFFMLRKGICKSKLMVDLHLMLKRGKLASKAIVNNLMLHHHYAAFTCRSNDSHLSFISPREYEFSCSNSPAYPIFQINKRNKHHHHHHGAHHHFPKSSYRYDDVTTVNAVQKMLEMLNNDISVEASPLVTLPGFGKSPIGKQLRITDSPFPLKDEGDSQVDKAADDFITKFYKDLKLQKNKAALESPYHNLWGR